MKTYELFVGEDLKIAEKIQQRRYQMLIHSCIYYRLDKNIISDETWNRWANELKDLQKQYPSIAEKVIFYDIFKDWDGSTGIFLPLDLDWVVKLANKLLSYEQKEIVNSVNIVDTPKKSVKKKLF